MTDFKNWNFSQVLFWAIQFALSGFVFFGVYQGAFLDIFLLDESWFNTTIVAASAVALVSSIYATRQATVQWMAEMIVTLGLGGTVYGLIVAFSGISPESIGDLTMAKQMAATLASGLGTALSSTLIAAFFGVWLSINSRFVGG